MGPYSEFLQARRAQSIRKLLENKNLDPDYRAMWQKHLNNLAIDEGEYLQRVREVYGNRYREYTKEWLT